MEKQQTTVPWTSAESWTQVVSSIDKTIAAMGMDDLAPLRILAQQIGQNYRDLEAILEKACHLSCPSCADVCCTRATVWYDLKDLLVIYLNTGSFPDRQIHRPPSRSCCNLGPSGCRLIRSDRPFICTWYICPDQKIVLDGLPSIEQGYGGPSVFSTLKKIKTSRKALEEAYSKAAFNQQ